MTDTVSIEGIPVDGNGGRLLPSRGDGRWRGMVRLLDAMPWWALVVIAGLTFISLHKLAGANVDPVNHAGATEVAAPRVIIKILAGAGQYLFPMLLLGEAMGALIASRRLGPRDTWNARNASRTVTGAESKAGGAAALGDGAASVTEGEKIGKGRGVWSAVVLNSLESRRFAALAEQYYREEGMRCESMRIAGTNNTGLKLFQDDSAKASLVVQFRAQGKPWVAVNQIRALRAAMDGERIEKGIFMTPGAFSEDARECARLSGVTLIDGKLLVTMIKRLPPVAQERLLRFAVVS
ncbi:MAG: restriction endonuclease [Gammaproteobacteria bacterium]|jgi:restriction system protein